MSHPDDATIERFVMGALDDDAAFVAHVGGCDACSRKLQREAEVELALIDVQAHAATIAVAGEEVRAAVHPRARLRTIARWAIAPTLALAAAAAALVWMGHRIRDGRATTEGAAVHVVTCPDGPKQVMCIAEAHRSGSRLEYPTDPELTVLGSKPGFTVRILPQWSDGAPIWTDAFFAKAKADLEGCVDRAIVSQDAPVRTGEIGVNFAVGPNGQLEDSQLAIVLKKDPPTRYLDDPKFSAEMALARCLRGTAQAFPFEGTGRDVRVSLRAQYVWRE